MKFMLDTMIYDLIINTAGLIDRLNLLSDCGKVVILCTHIQNDQLTKIPDERKRAEVSKITRIQVTTAGAVFGISKFGCATFGDGSQTGISIDQICSPSKSHTEDALIATTASRDADVLVTEDKRLFKRFKVATPGCKVWPFKKFLQFIQDYPTSKG